MAFDDSLGQLFGVEMKNQCFFSDGTVRVYCQLPLIRNLELSRTLNQNNKSQLRIPFETSKMPV